MSKHSRSKKDQYGSYVSKEEFEKYWNDYHKLEDISMKESTRQKEERLKKLNRNI